jgi:8-oxo-dGTP diphosphatase
MHEYPGQHRILVAVDCIIFGFDGWNIKLLLVERSLKPEVGKWSLMGGFMRPSESPEDAANRVLEERTGLKMYTWSNFGVWQPRPRPGGAHPVCSVLRADRYSAVRNADNQRESPRMVLLDEMPEMVFDHAEMVKLAKKQLRYKAASAPYIISAIARAVYHTAITGLV